MNRKNGISEDRDQQRTTKEQEEQRRDQERREDGTKGNLDLDKDGAVHRVRKENEESSTEQRGTGIPGFGV